MPNTNSNQKILIHEMCLRDGMHPKRHQISIDEMVNIAKGVDKAGVPLLEVTHGDGLGGASVNSETGSDGRREIK